MSGLWELVRQVQFKVALTELCVVRQQGNSISYRTCALIVIINTHGPWTRPCFSAQQLCQVGFPVLHHEQDLLHFGYFSSCFYFYFFTHWNTSLSFTDALEALDLLQHITLLMQIQPNGYPENEIEIVILIGFILRGLLELCLISSQKNELCRYYIGIICLSFCFLEHQFLQ